MIKMLFIILGLLAGCGSERVTKEITPAQPNAKQTRTQCWFETECKKVRVIKRSKWGKSRSCIKDVCKQVEVCQTEDVPVGI